MEIDAVVAWVDGADPAHAEKRARFAGTAPHPGAASAARFVESGEIYACIASLLKFAPFLRRIHVVTDAQRPDLLDAFAAGGICAPDRISLVDHREIFAGLGDVLPTFSSRSIEAVIHRAPGLAECFVYLNDDMLLTAPAGPTDFFRDGGPVLHGEMRRPALRRPLGRAKVALRRVLGRAETRPGHAAAQERGAALAGYEAEFLRAPHCPHPLRISTIAQALADRPGLLERQVAHRFRDRAQYWPIALANHAEMARGAPHHPAPEIAYIRKASDAKAGLARIAAGRVRSACIQNLDAYPEDARREVLSFLADHLGSHLAPAIRDRLRAAPADR